MCDALQELDMQERSMVLYRAGQKLKALAQIFEERRMIPGLHCKNTTKIAKIYAFR
jgi:hypothetical protein